MKPLRLLASCVLTLSLCLVPGCGDPLPPAEVTFVTGTEHHQFDPQRMSWAHDIRLAHLLYETLVTYDFHAMRVEPGVAERWDVSDDGKTYTFHLRDDAAWSNGQPVTAHDFIAAWRRVMLPDFANDYSRLTFAIRGAEAFSQMRAAQLEEYAQIAARGTGGSEDAARAMYDLLLGRFDETVGLSAPDDRTLVVELERPLPYFLSLVAFPTFTPVHAATLESILGFDAASGTLRADSAFWSDPDRLVTNGQYVLGARAFRRGLHLKQNPHYWNKDAMGNRSLNELIINNPQTALQAYEGGQAQVLLDLPSASDLAATLAASGRDDLVMQESAGTYFYNFNCLPTLPDGRKNPLADARVRRALSMTIDREAIVKHVTRLGQPIARTFVPVGALADYEPPVEAGITFQPDEARRLLAEAGYPGGEGLTGLSIIYNTGQGHEYIAQAVRAMWEKELGVVVTLEGMESKAMSERMKTQQYTISRASWFGDYPDPTTFLGKMHSGDNNNDNRWSNPAYDALLAQAAETRDEAERMRILQDAERILLEEAPMALIFQYVLPAMVHPDVRGLQPNPWNRWDLGAASVPQRQ